MVTAASGTAVALLRETLTTMRLHDAIGWSSSSEPGAREYVALAQSWTAAGASIVGGCCGTGVAHIRALAEAIAEPQPR